MANGNRRDISTSGAAVLYTAAGDVWMGPGSPSAPVVPESTPPRSWDYPVLWNVYRTVDAGKSLESDGITMSQLRALAKQTHVRAIIETVKDKQCKKEWTFTVVPQPGEKAAQAKARAHTDPRVAEISQFFECPDGENDFSEWLRMLLEDMLVLDAASVHRWRKKNGSTYLLEVYDGATIEPLLDERGRRPVAPQIAYQQFIKGVPFGNFSSEQLMYAPRNPRPGKVFGLSPVEFVATYINIALREDITRLSHYEDGNIPAGMIPLPAGWSDDQVSRWYSSFNAFVQGLPQNLVKLVPLPGGSGTPIFPQLELLKSNTWDEVWISLVCFAFGVSRSALIKEQNKGTSQTARSQADEEGEQTYTDWVRRRLNWIIRNWFGYSDIVARPRAEMEMDATKQADIDDKKMRNGSLQINEVRERDGLEPIADIKPGMVTATGYVTFEQSQAPKPAPVLPGAPDLAGAETGSETAAEKLAKSKKKRQYDSATLS